jgi:hypothetical protein
MCQRSGFIGSFGTTTVSVGASRLYALGWALSLVIGGLSYWIACLIFPVPGDDSQHRFEELAQFYDDHPLEDLDQVEEISKMGAVGRVSSMEDKVDSKETV